jgi:hypothetical protein
MDVDADDRRRRAIVFGSFDREFGMPVRAGPEDIASVWKAGYGHGLRFHLDRWHGARGARQRESGQQ